MCGNVVQYASIAASSFPQRLPHYPACNSVPTSHSRSPSPTTTTAILVASDPFALIHRNPLSAHRSLSGPSSASIRRLIAVMRSQLVLLVCLLALVSLVSGGGREHQFTPPQQLAPKTLPSHTQPNTQPSTRPQTSHASAGGCLL